MSHNANEVLQSSKQLHRQVQAVTLKAVNDGTKELQTGIRANIPEKRGQSAGAFEGYAASGALWRDVTRTEARRSGTTTIGDVYMMPGRSIKYKNIHEYGGIIRARRKPYLVFQVKGQWVRVKQVRIRAKRYFSGPRVRALRPRIEAAMAKALGKIK
jgi:phage gpG-like protein